MKGKRLACDDKRVGEKSHTVQTSTNSGLCPGKRVAGILEQLGSTIMTVVPAWGETTEVNVRCDGFSIRWRECWGCDVESRLG